MVSRTSKKRKFQGNQFSTEDTVTTPSKDTLEQTVNHVNNNVNDNNDASEMPVVVEVTPTAPQDSQSVTHSASKKKLSAGIDGLNKEHHSYEEKNFNFIMEFSMLKKLVDLIGTCPECSCDSNLTISDGGKHGLSHSFLIGCDNCAWSDVFKTSPKVRVKRTLKEGKKKTTGDNPFDVNLRAVIAFREIGGGLAAMETFCTIMNMKPPMTTKNYMALRSKVTESFINCARQSMQNAAKEAPCIPDVPEDNNVKDVIASFDGTWQKRGYASTNGVITSISGGKCVDYVVFSKNCNACKYWEKRQNQAGYAEWKGNHRCPVNHTGSAGSMESKGAVTMFKRSIYFNGLRYRSYLGDGK